MGAVGEAAELRGGGAAAAAAAAPGHTAAAGGGAPVGASSSPGGATGITGARETAVAKVAQSTQMLDALAQKLANELNLAAPPGGGETAATPRSAEGGREGPSPRLGPWASRAVVAGPSPAS
jgi:hypothetical protein|eukprot:COSAG01_NODE_1628_length_9684_cov_9.777673_5_plen_122_part_00